MLVSLARCERGRTNLWARPLCPSLAMGAHNVTKLRVAIVALKSNGLM
jgi:hypothetical protein